VLTYEVIYDILLREKQREELQKIEDHFWRDTLGYLREKQGMLDETRHKVDLFSAAERDKTHTQLRNIRRVLRSIYDLREKKILDIAVNKSRTGSKIIDVGNMLDVEKQLFESLVSEMNFFRQGLLNNILELRSPSILFEGEDSSHDHERRSAPAPVLPPGQAMVTLSREVAQFVGPELEVYGPFQSGEVAVLPEDIAAILVNQGAATLQAAPLQATSEASPPAPSLDDSGASADLAGIDEELTGPGDDSAEMAPGSPPGMGIDVPEMDEGDGGAFPESEAQPDMHDIAPSKAEIPE